MFPYYSKKKKKKNDGGIFLNISNIGTNASIYFASIYLLFIYYSRSSLANLASAASIVDRQQFIEESILRKLLMQSQVHKNTLWSSIHPRVWIVEGTEAIHT